MAGIKRKGTFDAKYQAGNSQKKQKKDEKRPKTSKPIQPLETETDSEPIVESDTTSQSGDDDGESWPSDHEGEEGDESGGVSEEDNEDGGIKIAVEAANEVQPKTNNTPTNGQSTGGLASHHA